jgi:sugar lactone lactonase YvrE
VQGQVDVLAGFQQGVARLSLGSALQVNWVCRLFDGAPQMRLNDAKADATGSIWAGCMNNDDEQRPDGGLLHINGANRTVKTVDSGYCVPNGPAIHPSGTWMLHTDSVLRTIYAFDLDAARGVLANRRVWKVLAPEEGYPDGMTFDAEGCLWLAHWGAGCVSRFAASGKLLRRIQLPTSHISNVCFGGDDLERLFVTSAQAGLSADQCAAQPLAGALFEVDAGGVLGLAGLAARG